jgi:hypothetical protein
MNNAINTLIIKDEHTIKFRPDTIFRKIHGDEWYTGYDEFDTIKEAKDEIERIKPLLGMIMNIG